MKKTIAFVHPEKTVYLDLPEDLFVQLGVSLRLGLAKTRFIDTKDGLHGVKANTFIFDEYATQPKDKK